MEHNRTQHSILKINRYSFGIALPKWMTRELGLEAGEKVNLEFNRGKKSIIISKSPNETELHTEQTPIGDKSLAEQSEQPSAPIAAPITAAPIPFENKSLAEQAAPMPNPITETGNFEYDDSDVIPLPEL